MTTCQYCHATVDDLGWHYSHHPRAGGCVAVAAAFDKGYSPYIERRDDETSAEFNRRKLALTRRRDDPDCAHCHRAPRLEGQSYCRECTRLMRRESMARTRARAKVVTL